MNFMSPLPVRMTKLPLDERGYPIPWFVAWHDGKPEFRAMDADKLTRAIREKRCWVCGEILGVNVCFVVGPMCGINRISSEPPSHFDCGRWSAENCPFLSNPRMVRREDAEINNETLREHSAGMAIGRNPGVTLLWITRSFEVIRDHKGGRLFSLGEPERTEWWTEGRKATLAEVQASVDSGCPTLEAMARQEPGAWEELQKAKQRFVKWLPRS